MPKAAGLPFIGNSIALLRDPLRFLRSQYAKLGPVFEVNSPGRRFVVLAGRDANRFASREGRQCLTAGPFWGRLTEVRKCPHLMLAVDGLDHAVLRKMHGRDVSTDTVDTHIGGLIALTRHHLAQTGVHHFIPARTLCRTLVSRQVHYMLSNGEAPVDRDTMDALLEVFRWETNALLLGKWPRASLRLPRHRRRVRQVEGFLDGLIERSTAGAPEGWFATVLRGRLEHPRLFTDGDVRMGFMLPFVAGVDTVGATLALLLAEVLGRPHLQSRLVEAVDGFWAQRGDEAQATGPTVSALRDIDDLRGAVLETLRLHPAAFAVYRHAARDFEFAGTTVAQGTDVLVFTTASHTDAAYFPDPLAFDVERHRSPRNEHRQTFALMPYGAGPHICLGAGMGEALLLLSVAVIFRRFRLGAEGLQHALTRRYDPSLVADRRFRVRLQPR